MALKIIDVSEHNQKIDWDKAKHHIDGTIIRCGYGMDMKSQDDLWWKYNADECTRLGIPFGVYLYSYADTDTKSKSEAAHVLRLIEGYRLSYPVYLDLEEEHKPDTRAYAVRGAKIFADIVEGAGHVVGIYANENWYKTIIGSALDKYTKWVAKYSTKAPDVPNVDIWQYTSSGSVPGLTGNGGRVDVNYCYRDFSAGSSDGGKKEDTATITIDGGIYMFKPENVKMGSQGTSVLLLQEILKARDIYKGELDRSSGSQTVAAINAYQSLRRSQGVEVGTNGTNDGCCGPTMWRDLIAI